jgi:6-phosphofructokinase
VINCLKTNKQKKATGYSRTFICRLMGVKCGFLTPTGSSGMQCMVYKEVKEV